MYNHNHNDKASTIPINKDHYNMVKFPKGDANLGLIISAIMELCSSSSPIDSFSFSLVGRGLEANLDPLRPAHSLGSKIDGLSNNSDSIIDEFAQILSGIDGVVTRLPHATHN
jgi:hypothetical protein